MKPEIVKWNKIQKFSDAAAFARRHNITEPVQYIGTVKLHGTNAGVRRTSDRVLYPQSRNGFKDEGHMGFVQFVREREEDINFLIDHTLTINNLDKDTDVTLYGEWVGPGVQRGVAISQLPEKQWVIFGSRLEDGYQLAPSVVELPYQRIYSIYNVQVERQVINFFESDLKEIAARFTDLTLAIDAKCPWGERFGIDGAGEGLVWRPVNPDLRSISELWFKTKGEQHRGKSGQPKVKIKSNARWSPDVIEFVKEHLTERRLEQGLEALQEQGLLVSMRSTKNFLSFVLNDLRAETENEREVSGLEWKSIGAEASRQAVEWFKGKVNSVY